MDERVVALQKTLEKKQQERQKRKETEKVKSKLNDQMAVQNTRSYNHEKVNTYTQPNHVSCIYSSRLHFPLPLLTFT